VYDPSFWSHLFYTDDVVVYLLEGHNDVLWRNIARQMPDNGFNRFIHLCIKCKECMTPQSTVWTHSSVLLMTLSKWCILCCPFPVQNGFKKEIILH
jgi:hypothetical protein